MRILKTADYDRWFARLRDVDARARINARLRRIELQGTLVGDCKSVGERVVELRFGSGPGYRIYVYEEKGTLLLLLAGGDKSTQRADIAKARRLLRDWRSDHGR